MCIGDSSNLRKTQPWPQPRAPKLARREQLLWCGMCYTEDEKARCSKACAARDVQQRMCHVTEQHSLSVVQQAMCHVTATDGARAFSNLGSASNFFCASRYPSSSITPVCVPCEEKGGRWGGFKGE